MRVELRVGDQDGDETAPERAPSAATPSTVSGELFDSEELRQLSGYARLAELLKEAHGVLRGMDLELPDRADFVRRLLVITAASRHDQDDAMRRLERFLSAVDEKRGAISLPDLPEPNRDSAAPNSQSAADQPSSVRKAG